MLTWNFFKNYLLSHRAGALIRKLAWLCIVAIAVGVASLVIVISVMNGFNEAIRNRLLAVEPHVILTQVAADEQGLSGTHLSSHELLQKIRTSPQVSEVYTFESQDVIIRTIDGTFGGGVARGLEGQSFHQFMRRVSESQMNKKERQRCAEKKASGQSEEPGVMGYMGPRCPHELSAGSLALKKGEIIMGSDLARSLGIVEGDQVTIIPPESLLLPPGEAPPFEKVTVKSLLSTSLEDIDGKMIFYGLGESFAHFDQAASLEKGIEVRLKDAGLSGVMADEWAGLGWERQTWEERNSSLFFALKMEKLAMGTFLSLSALITSFSIITVLVMLMAQKRQDVGILMAMGMSAAQTRRIFTQVGMVLAISGVGSGLVIGLAVSLYLHFFPPEVLPNIYYDSTIPATVHWPLVGVVFLSAIVLAFFGSVIPVRANVKLSPSEALRS